MMPIPMTGRSRQLGVRRNQDQYAAAKSIGKIEKGMGVYFGSGHHGIPPGAAVRQFGRQNAPENATLGY